MGCTSYLSLCRCSKFDEGKATGTGADDEEIVICFKDQCPFYYCIPPIIILYHHSQTITRLLCACSTHLNLSLKINVITNHRHYTITMQKAYLIYHTMCDQKTKKPSYTASELYRWENYDDGVCLHNNFTDRQKEKETDA